MSAKEEKIELLEACARLALDNLPAEKALAVIKKWAEDGDLVNDVRSIDWAW